MALLKRMAGTEASFIPALFMRNMHYFKKRDKFDDFTKEDLKNYKTFKKILITIKNFYKIDEYDLKEIDKYIWQLGKEYFPKKY